MVYRSRTILFKLEPKDSSITGRHLVEYPRSEPPGTLVPSVSGGVHDSRILGIVDQILQDDKLEPVGGVGAFFRPVIVKIFRCTVGHVTRNANKLGLEVISS